MVNGNIKPLQQCFWRPWQPSICSANNSFSQQTCWIGSPLPFRPGILMRYNAVIILLANETFGAMPNEFAK